MGLCKCPKKKVTNQFCYEHRVNVCQYCIVSHHPKCIVQSYLQWLQDCDYDPSCQLCKRDLEIDDCIRLTCFHVFHWDCLDNYARNMPDTTAPAGYTCPICREPIIPKPNEISPVADVLRQKISSVNWARIGLGLPLLSNEERKFKNDKQSHSAPINNASTNNYMNDKNKRDVVVFMNEATNFGRNEYSSNSSLNLPRRIVHLSENNPIPEEVDDIDEKKYLRRQIFGLSRRKFNQLKHCMKAVFMKFKSPVFVIFFVLFVIFFMSLYGRMSEPDESPLILNSDVMIDNRNDVKSSNENF